MPDDKHNAANNPEDKPEIAPSTLFLEMMRQAAAQHPQDSPASDDETTSTGPDPGQDVAAQYHTALEIAATRSSPMPEAPPSQAVPPPPQIPIYEPPVDLHQDDDERHEAAMKAQRIRRLKRRQEQRRRRRMGMVGGLLSTLFVVLISAALVSTIFTWFTQPEFFQQDVASGLQVANATSAVAAIAVQPTAISTPNWLRRIGIVAGHRGPENDPGAVCNDNGQVTLTEREINFAVAQIVVRELRAQGFSVDLLDEFDPRLDNYQAAALVSLHANDCRNYGERVSGFLVARAAARPPGGLDDLLAECIAQTYTVATQLERRFTLTVDMTDYHTFREINALTPAAILEMGFMRDDKDLLTNRQEDIARGVIEGIQCFLQREASGNLSLPPQATATLMATEQSSTP